MLLPLCSVSFVVFSFDVDDRSLKQSLFVIQRLMCLSESACVTSRHLLFSLAAKFFKVTLCIVRRTLQLFIGFTCDHCVDDARFITHGFHVSLNCKRGALWLKLPIEMLISPTDH